MKKNRDIVPLPSTQQYVAVHGGRLAASGGLASGSVLLLTTPGALGPILAVLVMALVPVMLILTNRILDPRSCTSLAQDKLRDAHRRAKRLEKHVEFELPAGAARLQLEKAGEMLTTAHQAEREGNEVLDRLVERSRHRVGREDLRLLLPELSAEGELLEPDIWRSYDRDTAERRCTMHALAEAKLEISEILAYRESWTLLEDQRLQALRQAERQTREVETRLTRLEANQKFSASKGLGIDPEAVAASVAARQHQLERLTRDAGGHANVQRAYLESLEELQEIAPLLDQ